MSIDTASMLRKSSLFAMVLACAAPAGAAFAEAVVEDRIKQGMDRFIVGDLEGARISFLQAFENLVSPRAVAYIILVDARLGKCDEAREMTLWLDTSSLSQELRAGVQAVFAPGTGTCPFPDGEMFDTRYRCTGSVHVVSYPEGGEVWTSHRGMGPGVKLWGNAPIDITGVCPGDLALRVRLAMHEEVIRTVRVKPGEHLTVEVRLLAIDPNEYYDRFRAPIGFGAGVSTFAGAAEDGTTWNIGKGISVGPSMTVQWRELRVKGELHYMQIPGGTRAWRRAGVLRGHLEYAFPLHRMVPLPTLDSRVISIGLGAGAALMMWDPRAIGGSVDATIHMYWLTLRGFYSRAWGFNTGAGISWTAGFEVAVDFYLP